MEINKIKQYLSNIHENYLNDIKDKKQYIHILYHGKCLGAMEAILVVLGILQPGTPFHYQETTSTFKLFWVFPIKLIKKESYSEHILRLTKETLKQQ